ncbi:hypothetical protein POL58_22920 [Nannocystis sp. ncelm1]|uniref:Uncharacterized protein n=1 Tax=Nannocystis radixulma TaxID=2995305 RepID=A0ABT5BC32_9BACT|nr:hypothetical protein [Nannocystis radixulma]MDC0670627.1 hypothetical protein [Nannocystis radixulma]
MPEEPPSRVRRTNLSRSAIEEPHSGDLLELRDAPVERLPRHAERTRCRAEAAELDDRREAGECVQVECRDELGVVHFR